MVLASSARARMPVSERELFGLNHGAKGAVGWGNHNAREANWWDNQSSAREQDGRFEPQRQGSKRSSWAFRWDNHSAKDVTKSAWMCLTDMPLQNENVFSDSAQGQKKFLQGIPPFCRLWGGFLSLVLS